MAQGTVSRWAAGKAAGKGKPAGAAEPSANASVSDKAKLRKAEFDRPLAKKEKAEGDDEAEDGGKGPANDDGATPEDIWAGDADAEEITAEEATAFVGWLEENEPSIHGVLVKLAEAVAGGDEAEVETLTDELMEAKTELDDYDELTPDQREVLLSELEKLGEDEDPEIAIARAVIVAREESEEDDDDDDDDDLEDDDDSDVEEDDDEDRWPA